MRCEFVQEYKVRTETGEVKDIRAGTVCFIHPDKAVDMLFARVIRPVDYGDIQHLPYINEHGRLAALCDNQPQAKLDDEKDSGAITQDVYRMRDYSDDIKVKLEDMAESGGGVAPEEIDKEAYRSFVKEVGRYVGNED
jgi:hypothetical protein